MQCHSIVSPLWSSAAICNILRICVVFLMSFLLILVFTSFFSFYFVLVSLSMYLGQWRERVVPVLSRRMYCIALSTSFTA